MISNEDPKNLCEIDEKIINDKPVAIEKWSRD